MMALVICITWLELEEGQVSPKEWDRLIKYNYYFSDSSKVKSNNALSNQNSADNI
jgi:hypothetical protein